LLALLGIRGREEKQTWARNTAATMWQPTEARVVVARSKEDSREGKQDRDRGRVTRGGHPSRRWSGSGSIATAGGAALRRRQRGQNRGAEDARGRREEGRGPRDSFGKPKNLGTSL
jgi:hypothetical protein